MTQPIKNWKERFDEMFPEWKAGVGNCVARNQDMHRVKSFISELLSEATREAVEKKIDRELIHKISSLVIEKEMKTMQRCWAKGIDLYSVACDRVNRPFLDNAEADDILKLLKDPIINPNK